MKTDLIVIALVLGMLAVTGLRREASRHGIHALVWRHFTGSSLDGISHTNASWLTRGTVVHHSSGKALAFHHLPRLYRAGIRTGSTVLILAVLYGLHAAFALTIHVALAAGALVIIAGGILGARAGRTGMQNRAVVSPMAVALSRILGVTQWEAESSLYLAPNYRTVKKGEIGTLTLPDEFAARPEERAALEHLISSRLAVGVECVFHTTARPMRMDVIRIPDLPKIVKFSEHLDIVEACPIGKIFVGLDNNHKPYYIDLEKESAHIGASCRSGSGKSAWLQVTVSMVLHQNPDAKATLVDPKMESLENLAGIPGVTLESDPSDIPAQWKAVEAFRLEMMDRLEARKKDPTLEFPINLLVIDELPQFMEQSRAYWRGIKSSKDPAIPPVVQDIASIFWMGRAASCHAIVVAQRLSDRALGNMGLRDGLGAIGLGSYRANQYAMVTGNGGTAPKAQKGRGRWLWIADGDETWVQNVYGTPAELREWALSNRVGRIKSEHPTNEATA